MMYARTTYYLGLRVSAGAVPRGSPGRDCCSAPLRCPVCARRLSRRTVHFIGAGPHHREAWWCCHECESSGEGGRARGVRGRSWRYHSRDAHSRAWCLRRRAAGVALAVALLHRCASGSQAVAFLASTIRLGGTAVAGWSSARARPVRAPGRVEHAKRSSTADPTLVARWLGHGAERSLHRKLTRSVVATKGGHLVAAVPGRGKR